MGKSIWNKVRGSVIGVLPFYLFTFLLLTSCSEDDTTEDEYANWRERNEEAIVSWATNSAYRKILTFTKDDAPDMILTNSDYIYVEVLESGDGTETPLYTDTCRVAYRGRLIPTTSYPDGYVFDQDFAGDFSWETSGTFDYVPGLALVPGFATALQNMHQGDYWRVYVPYELGYGTTTSGSIPAYSDLVFDIALFDFWHPDDSRPAFKAR